MDFQLRIQAFEDIYRERLQLRLSAIGPDHDPDNWREMLALPRPRLIREDNRHHLLPEDMLAEWRAGNAEEKWAIMAEYEAANDDYFLPDEWAEVYLPEEWIPEPNPLDYEDDGEVYDMVLLE
jgi:hypothetical protein